MGFKMRALLFTLLLATTTFLNCQNNLSTTYNCETSTPSSVANCHTRTTDAQNICCYLSGVQKFENTRFCLSIPKTSYNGDTKYYHNGATYNISCPNYADAKKKATLKSCGDGSEAGMRDCATSSSLVESCCYNSVSDNGPKGCYWLGSKFEGKTKWAGLELDCDDTYYKVSFLSLLMIFLL